jgi:hypothetical protein
MGKSKGRRDEIACSRTLVRTLEKEVGEMTEKQMRKTSVWG